MGKNLQEILEQQFNFLNYLKLSLDDYNNMNLKELNWMYARLIKDLKDKEKANG